jgi:membrane-associated phospholipid phosphatase
VTQPRGSDQPARRQWWVRGSARWQYAVVAGEVVVVWSAALGVMLGLGWVVTEGLRGSIDPLDTDLAEWLADQRTATLTDLAEIGGTGGDTITVCALAAVVAIGTSIWAGSPRPLVFLAVGLAGQALIYAFTSQLVKRTRPPVELLDHGLDPNASFPSGHVSTAVMFSGGVVALAWTYAAPRWRAPATLLLVVPLVVVVSRVYQGAHFLSDSLASLIVMPCWVVALTVLILRSRFEPRASSSSAPTASPGGP